MSRTSLFLPHFHVICDLLLNRCTATWNLFVKYYIIQYKREFGHYHDRGGEWYLEKRGSWKILSESQNLGSVYDKSRSLVFSWFVFTYLSLETFYQRVSGLDF